VVNRSKHLAHSLDMHISRIAFLYDERQWLAEVLKNTRLEYIV